MDKISTIKQNILYFVESQGFGREEFFNKIEISYSNFKGKSLFSEIGADKIVKILTFFPQINPDWLLTGKGEILRNVSEKREESSEDLDLLKERLSGYKDLNGIYLKKIDSLQTRLDECQSEKKRV